MQVPQSFSEKSDVSSKEIKERSKLKSKINNTQSELNDIIDLTEDKETKSTKDKDKKKEMFTTKTVAPTNQISNSISFSGGNVPNYNQQFFDYKSFKAPTKRKNSGTDTLMIKKSKKHSNSWIKKESNKPKHNSPPKSPDAEQPFLPSAPLVSWFRLFHPRDTAGTAPESASPEDAPQPGRTHLQVPLRPLPAIALSLPR